MVFVDMDPALAGLGWTSFFHQQLLTCAADTPEFAEHPPDRIAVDRGTEYALIGPRGARRAVLAGRLVRDFQGERRPCVGDFVLAVPVPNGDISRIEHVFERRSVFRRKVAGTTAEGQAIAANVDVAIVVSALAPEGADPHAESHGLNQGRIERYLRAIHDAKVRAVVVVNKADLHPAAEEQTRALAEALRHGDVLAVSAFTGHGLDRLGEYVGPGTTAVLVGSSGVGKSSLMNAWLGRAAQRVAAVREEDTRGRHTTTHRELFALPSGGWLVDTPGMREFALFADDDASATATGFEDIDALAGQCRFRDCSHGGEPGCAVLEAVERGELSVERVLHAQKLARELAFQQRRHDALMRQAERQKNRQHSRAVREGQRAKRGTD
jgi:ribosome biogenesis GTPase